VKNNLKNRLILFTASYVVSFLIARVVRNYKYNQFIKGQILLAEWYANNANKQDDELTL